MKLFSSQKMFKQKKGFTLIEVMVAVSIFTVVMVVALGAILSIVNANRKAQSLHTVINNVNLAVETMTRDLRTGYNYECGSAEAECEWGTTASYDQISFASLQVAETRESENAIPVSYRRYEDGSGHGYLEKDIDGEGWVRITDESVDIEALSFRVWGIRTLSSVWEDTQQPKIILNLKAKITAYGNSSEFAIQTFISQRYLDF